MIETLVKSLTDILSDEKTIYDRILAISEEMRGKIVKEEPELLSQIVEKQTALAEQADRLDESRASVTASLAEALGLGAAPPLSALCEAVPEADQRNALLQVRAELGGLLQRLTAINEINQELLAQKRDYFAMMMDSLLSAEQLGTTYDSKGGAESYSGSAGLFDQQI